MSLTLSLGSQCYIRAVADRSIKLVEWHLNHGAQLELHTGPGGDPLTRAAAMSSLSIVRILIKYGASLENTDALIGATASIEHNSDVIKTMEYLLDEGLDVNHVQKLRYTDQDTIFDGTALHRAVEREDAERLQLLLDRGADPSIIGVLGKTPLEVARIFKRQAIVEILEKHGERNVEHPTIDS